MTNVGYWCPRDDQPGADQTLIYLFGASEYREGPGGVRGVSPDPDWIAARQDSEEKAGGSLTVTDGVKSVFLSPTDYSPTR